MGEITPVTVWVSMVWRERREEGSHHEVDGKQLGWAAWQKQKVGFREPGDRLELTSAGQSTPAFLHTHSQRTRVCRHEVWYVLQATLPTSKNAQPSPDSVFLPFQVYVYTRPSTPQPVTQAGVAEHKAQPTPRFQSLRLHIGAIWWS